MNLRYDQVAYFNRRSPKTHDVYGWQWTMHAFTRPGLINKIRLTGVGHEQGRMVAHVRTSNDRIYVVSAA